QIDARGTAQDTVERLLETPLSVPRAGRPPRRRAGTPLGPRLRPADEAGDRVERRALRILTVVGRASRQHLPVAREDGAAVIGRPGDTGQLLARGQPRPDHL